MIVKKLTNISELQVNVMLTNGNILLVATGQSVENVDVKNLAEIQEYVKVEQNLSEVPVHEGRTYLKG